MNSKYLRTVIFMLFFVAGLFLLLRSKTPDVLKFNLSNHPSQIQNSVLLNNDNSGSQAPISHLKNNSASKAQEISSVNELIELLKTKDLCEVINTPPDGPNFSTKEEIKALFSFSNTFSDDHEEDRTSEFILGNIVNPGPVDPRAGVDTNKVIEFYRALVYGKLISPTEGYESFVDYKLAESILSDLEIKNPSNGAFPFFRAAVLLNEGAKEETLRPILIKAMQSEEFNTYHTYIWRPVLQRSFQNMTSQVLSQLIMREARIINYTDIMAAAKNLVKSGNVDYAKLTASFAKKLKPSIPEDGRFEFFEWSALEFAHSEVLRYHSEKFLKPDQKIPFAVRPMDLMTFRKEPNYKDAFPDVPDGEVRKCNSGKLLNYFKHEEQIYADYLNKLPGVR